MDLRIHLFNKFTGNHKKRVFERLEAYLESAGFNRKRKGFHKREARDGLVHVVEVHLMKHYNELWVTLLLKVLHYDAGTITHDAWKGTRSGREPHQKDIDARIAATTPQQILAHRAGTGCRTNYPVTAPDQLHETLDMICAHLDDVMNPYFNQFCDIETAISTIEKDPAAAFGGHSGYLMVLYYLSGEFEKLRALCRTVSGTNTAPINNTMKNYLLAKMEDDA